MGLIKHLRNPLIFGLALMVLALAGLSRLAAQQRPYTVEDLKKLAQGGVTEKRLLDRVKERGISFAPTREAIENLRAKGVPESVLTEIRSQIPRGQSPEFYLREGDRLLGEGRYGEAITYYRKILEQVPGDPGAQVRIGRAEQQQREAEAQAQRREQEERERAQLPYYRQQLRDAVLAGDCATVALYGKKILSLEPRDRGAEEAVGQCFQPFRLKQTLSGHARVQLGTVRDQQGEAFTVTEAGHILSVAFSPHGRLLASGSRDTTIKLWDVASGALTQTLAAHQDFVSSVAFSPDGRTLASGSGDKTIKLWDVASGVLKGTLTADEDFVRSVAFSPDGRLLASGGPDKTIKLWDVASGTLRQTLSGHQHWVLSVAFGPDGRLLASGSIDKTIRLWDVASGTLKQTLAGHGGRVNSVAFSPDGRLLASGSDDKTIKFWDGTIGALKQTLTGHESGVNSVAFSTDGRTLASGSADHTIRLWDVASGALKETLEGHESFVNSVAFSPDGRLLASGSYDATIKLWERAP